MVVRESSSVNYSPIQDVTSGIDQIQGFFHHGSNSVESALHGEVGKKETCLLVRAFKASFNGEKFGVCYFIVDFRRKFLLANVIIRLKPREKAGHNFFLKIMLIRKTSPLAVVENLL